LTGVHAIREALRAGRRPLHRLWWPAGEDGDRGGLRALAERGGVPIGVSEADGGPAEPALEVGPLPEVELESLLGSPGDARTILALDGVEDPQNLGAIARVAESVGVSGLVLTHRRSPPLSPAVSRASAGAIEWLPVARVPNLPRALAELQRAGFWIFGADPEAELDLFSLPERGGFDRVGVVLGAEGRGLRPGVLRSLDFRVRIPMQGQVASLNVATAGAVMLFELARLRRGSPAGSGPFRPTD
jgi:23S rRNA (guanosine2251-2'-O)-methyltransferase